MYFWKYEEKLTLAGPSVTVAMKKCDIFINVDWRNQQMVIMYSRYYFYKLEKMNKPLHVVFLIHFKLS